MGLLDPTPPPYDVATWRDLPLPEKARLVCQAWAIQGYGTPPSAYVFYLLKIGLYVGAWLGFCSLSPSLGAPAELGRWWLEPLAFQKAILWSLAFEIAGLGCGSGPLTGRYFPPLGGFLYFLRPGTTKLPLFEGAPLVGGRRRGLLDVGLYGALLVALVWALTRPRLDPSHFYPIAVLVPLLGVLDKTLFLAARAEHYWVTVMCFALLPSWIAGAKAVQLALWFWAGVSKLNHHFPTVVGVMTSNGPFTRIAALRKAMYRAYPDDLRPSRLATVMGHVGTALELGVPMVLVAGSGGTVTTVGLVLMVVLHVYITSHVPMGVPLEWNVMVVYGGFFLCGAQAKVSLSQVIEPVTAVTLAMAALLVTTTVILPLVGNLAPRLVSFLLAMRYYAGNWAYSVWLFRDASYRKLDTGLVKTSPWIHDQLAKFYDPDTAEGLFGKVIAFRLMHLHGRALQKLLPHAIGDASDYYWVDGEIVAGLALGYNFGEGHLHSEQLLRSIQAQCGFEEGELRCIFVESQALGGSTLHARVHDAKAGLLHEAEISVAELRELTPWPTAPGPTAD